MAEPQNPVEQEEGAGQENPIVAFFSNLLATFKLAFPFPSPQKKFNNSKRIEAADASSSKTEPIKTGSAAVDGAGGEGTVVLYDTPNHVSFRRRSEGYASVELEAEDAERRTNPLVLWQVYAVGGFFIARWAWARWNERRGQKKSDEEKSDDEPSED